jgi:cation diffusion facilitator CzcD-associated flavoprotein CzcO
MAKPNSESSGNVKKKRVLVVGAGAAGKFYLK